MTEQGIVKESLIEIFSRNGYKESNRLTQRDFDHISQEIENQTGILISGSTIKRLLNGEFSRLPQIATLDAVSKYLGYKNWLEYKSAITQKEEALSVEKNNGKSELNRDKNQANKFKIFKYIAIACLTTGIIGIVYFISITKPIQLSNLDKASFSVKKNTTNEIPNTVVFNYDIDNVIADSFFIQQSWDKNRRVRVYKNSHTLTDIYYEPGYHIAKLIANDSVIKAIEISIPTDRWFLFAKDLKPSSKPEYIKTENAIKNGVFGLTEKDVLVNKIKTDQEKEYVYTFFPGKIEVNSDNFVLKTKVRMREVKNNFCPYITLEVFTQRYFMFFKGTPKGCSSESLAQFGEQLINGKESDLSSLGFDVKEWMDIELSVINKQVKIKLNNKEVFSTNYKTPNKLITGFGFMSNGLCEIDFVELKGLDGKVVYENDFDN